MFGGGFPFGAFGGGGHDSDDEQGDSNNTQYYEILQISKNASQDDIKKAYMKQAKLHHPDKKGGDTQKFKKIGEAYQTLKDPEKRKMYDRFGKNGPKMGGGDDLLNMFFGGGGGSRRAQKQVQKVQATKKALEVTLENIYNGEMLKIPHKRTRCCQKCGGKGGENVEKCKPCKGQGRVVQMYQMGPGMYQQVQKNCDKCQGQGQIISQGGKCKVCGGKKILEKQKIIEVPIEKGTPNNYPIKMPGQGNELPDALAGDLIFVVQEKQHKVFKRVGADLFIKKQISLVEALTGIQFKIKHLDGVQYNIYTGKGQVLSDQMKKVVRGLGMPLHRDPMSHGNLIVQFRVVMPKRDDLTKQQIEALSSILPGKVNKRPVGDYEMFEEFELANMNTNQQGGHKPEDDYDQQEDHPGIGCSTH